MAFKSRHAIEIAHLPKMKEWGNKRLICVPLSQHFYKKCIMSLQKKKTDEEKKEREEEKE